MRRWPFLGALAVAGVGFILWERPVAPPVMPPAVVAEEGLQVAFLPEAEAAGVALPLHVAGRVAVDADWPEGFRHVWPGVVVTARFAGDGVDLRLADGVNRWRVTVDGRAAELTRVGDGVVRISGLGGGEHVLRAEKLSESWEDAVFGGVFVATEEMVRAVEGPDRVVEVYGDSESVGYGVRSERRECPGEGVYLATDTTLAFPALVARAFGADLDLVARSGIGLMRDFGEGATAGRMIDVADRAAIGPGEAVAIEGERVVVIALGANDFQRDLTADDPWADTAAMVAPFADLLADFARDKAGPDGEVVLVAYSSYGEDLVAAHERAFAALQGEVAAHMVVVPEMGQGACDWHMSVDDQAEVARLVAEAITLLPSGWEPVESETSGQE
jgi:lysophospholipase L1-like esterase